MIKENIQININDKSFDAEIIAPSQVMTSTPQEETADITKSPNFILKVHDAEKTINVTDIVEVSFSLGDYDYTANMKAYNRGAGIIALQYDSNLTAEEVTHTFEANSPQLETSKDLSSGDVKGNDTYFMYDGTPVRAEDISFGPLNYHTITVGEPTPTDITLTPKSAFPEITTGEFVDTLTATYKGITITVPVTLIITDADALVLNADTYYTAYDTNEKEDPHNSVFVTATFNGEDINPAHIEFVGLTYNYVDVKSDNRVRFKPNAEQIDGHPGVYTDDVTANYQGAQTSCQVTAVAVDTAAQTGLTVDKPFYACSANQNTIEQTDAHVRILYNGTELDPMNVQVSGTYKDQHWAWIEPTGDFTAYGMETFSGYDIVTITYNNETISCLLKIDIVGLETPEEHTLAFSPTGPFYTYYDKYSNETTRSENLWLLYDNSYVTNPMLYLDHNMGTEGSYIYGSPTGDRINWYVNTATKSYETGEYTDTFTATYLGLTASCDVTAVIVDTSSQHTLADGEDI